MWHLRLVIAWPLHLSPRLRLNILYLLSLCRAFDILFTSNHFYKKHVYLRHFESWKTEIEATKLLKILAINVRFGSEAKSFHFEMLAFLARPRCLSNTELYHPQAQISSYLLENHSIPSFPASPSKNVLSFFLFLHHSSTEDSSVQQSQINSIYCFSRLPRWHQW